MILEKLFGTEKPKEEPAEETPTTVPEPEETEIGPKPYDMRIIERWQRNKNGAPVKKYSVQTYSIHVGLCGGINFYWNEDKNSGTLKAAQTYLTNIQKPLPEDKVISL
jgi:hypothetical protein